MKKVSYTQFHISDIINENENANYSTAMAGCYS